MDIGLIKIIIIFILSFISLFIIIYLSQIVFSKWKKECMEFVLFFSGEKKISNDKLKSILKINLIWLILGLLLFALIIIILHKYSLF
jgi:hypothetical protein